MAENDDRDVNTPEPQAEGGDEGGQSASEGLHIAGQGHEALDDGVEHQGGQGDLRPSEDVFGNANVQSGRRTTTEGMLNGLPQEGETAADQSPVVADDYVPSEPDNAVDSEFDAVRPDRAPSQAGDEDDEGEDDEDERPRTAEQRRGDVPPGQERGATGQPGARQGEGQQQDPLPGSDIGATDPVAGEGGTAGPAAADGASDDGDEPAEQVPTPAEPDTEPTEAQTPTVSATAADGIEDLALKLTIGAALNDTDGGGETLSVVIGGLPDGFSFSNGAGSPVGTPLGGGSWSIPPEQLGDLYLVRPPHYSGDLALTVTVTATEPDGSTATTTTPLPVHVEAVADAPALAAVDTAGTENEWIELTINAGLVDADGSETLTVYVTDLPAGARLDRGTQLTAPQTLPNGVVLAAGTWVLSSPQLAGLKVLPPKNVSDDFALRVFALTEEDMNGARAVSGPATINVDVGVVAPSVSGTGAGREDEWADVDLNAVVNAEDRTETLVVTIEGLPAGALIRYKDGAALTTDGDGNFVVALDRLDDVQVRWGEEATPTHSDADITFQVRAKVTDADVGTDLETPRDTSESVADVTVTIAAVADAPKPLSVADTAGLENTAIPLSISTGLVDTDLSETLTVYITGVPKGAVIAGAQPAGTLPAGVVTEAGTEAWAVTVASAADLAGLTVTPPDNVSKDFTLKVYAVAEETSPSEPGEGQIAVPLAVTGPESIAVKVGVVAPDVTAAGEGEEDGWATVELTGVINAADGNEALTVYLTGVPDKVEVIYADGNGAPVQENGEYVIPEEDVGRQLKMRWKSPEHTDQDITFGLRAVVTDEDGDSNQRVVPEVVVGMKAVADKLTITAGGEGNEDALTGAGGTPGEAPIAVDIDIALEDRDGSEKLLGQDGSTEGSVWLVTTDAHMVDGTLKLGTSTLGARAVTGFDGDVPVFGSGPQVMREGKAVYAYEIPATAFAVAATGTAGHAVAYSLPNLTFLPVEHNDADVSFEVVATVDDRGESTRTTKGEGSIVIKAVADVDRIAASPGQGVEHGADAAPTAGWINVPITTLEAIDETRESLTLYIQGVPRGAKLAFGPDGLGEGPEIAPVSGVVVLNQASTGNSARLTTAEDTVTYSIRIGTADMAAVRDALFVRPADGSSSDIDLKLTLVSTEEKGPADWSAPEQAWTTAEVHIDIDVLAPTVSGDGAGREHEWVDVRLSPQSQAEGDEVLTLFIENLPAGAELRYGSTGAALEEDPAGVYEVATGHYDDVQVRWKQEPGTQHSDLDIGFDVRAVITDPDGDSSDAVSLVTVKVAAVADQPLVKVEAPELVMENQRVNLDLSAVLADKDGSETITAVYVTGVRGDLSKGSRVDTNVTLADGTELAAGSTWLLTTADLAGLYLIPPADDSTDLDLVVYGVAEETDPSEDGDGQIALPVAVSKAVEVHVDLDVAAPTVVVEGSGVEDQWAQVSLTSLINHKVGNETLTIYLEGIHPDVAVRYADGSAVTYENGRYVIHGEQVELGLEMKWGTEHTDQSIVFDVRAVVKDKDGEDAETVEHVTVDVAADADRLSIEGDGSGMEDDGGTSGRPRIAVGIDIDLDDTDGSEKLLGHTGPAEGAVWLVSSDAAMAADGLYLKGELVERLAVTGRAGDNSPTFEPGTQLTDGDGKPLYAYRIPASAFTEVIADGIVTGYTLDGLDYKPLPDSDADADFEIFATVIDRDESRRTSEGSGRIIVRADADAPDLEVAPTGGMENTHIPLSIDAALTDTDGSERLTVYITGVPRGAKLYNGGSEPLAKIAAAVTFGEVELETSNTYAFEFTAQDDVGALLSNLTIEPPPNNSKDFRLTVHAVTEEERDGDWDISTKTLDVHVGTMAPTLNPIAPLTLTEATSVNDHWHALNITAAIQADHQPTGNAADTETLRVMITDLPTGARIGVEVDGVVRALDPEPSGGYRLTQDMLGKTFISAPMNNDNEFTFNVQAIVDDVDMNRRAWRTDDANDPFFDVAPDTAASPVRTVTVTVDAHADAAVVTMSGEGIEDRWQSLDVSVVTQDTSETITGVTLSGLLAGTRLRLVSYDDDGNAVYTPITVTDGRAVLPVDGTSQQEVFDNLEFMAPRDWSGVMQFTAAVTTTEHGEHGVTIDPEGQTLVTEYPLSVRVWGIADKPTLDVVKAETETGTPTAPGDGYLPDPVSDAYVPTDKELSNLVFYLRPEGQSGTTGIFKARIEAFEKGWYDPQDLPLATFLDKFYPNTDLVLMTVKAGRNQTGDGPGEGVPVWYESGFYIEEMPEGGVEDNLTHKFVDAFKDITLTPPGGDGGDGGAGDTDGTPPTDTETGFTRVIDEDSLYTITFGPNGDLIAESGEQGEDDYPKSLDGSETLHFRIAPLSAQGLLVIDGTEVRGSAVVSAEQLMAGAVKIGGVPNWSGENLQFTVTSIAREGDAFDTLRPDEIADLGEAEGPERTITLTVNPLTDQLIVSTVAGGNEDGEGAVADVPVPVTLTPTITLGDDDKSEVLSAVVMTSSDVNLIGSKVFVGSTTIAARPVLHFDDDGLPVLGGPDDTARDGLYGWDLAEAFPLGEFHETYVGQGIRIEPIAHSAVDMTYNLYAQATEQEGGARTKEVVDQIIAVDAVADAPRLVLTKLAQRGDDTVMVGTEDSALILGIDADLVDRDTSELLSVTLEGVPAGWVVRYVNAQGNLVDIAAEDEETGLYQLPAGEAELASVRVVPPHDLHTELGREDLSKAPTFTIRATATEQGADEDVAVRSKTTEQTFRVIIDPQADKPFLVVRNARALEDHGPIDIDIVSHVTDVSDPETLKVYVGDVPAGAKLIDADGNQITLTETFAGRTWHVVTGNFEGLKIVPAAHSNVDFTLKVRAVSVESNGHEAYDEADLKVTVVGVTDTPTLDGKVIAGDVIDLLSIGAEDGGTLDPQLGRLGTLDVDGENGETSETVTLVLKNIPSHLDVFMQPGREAFMKYIGGGRWAVDGDHLGELRFAARGENFSGRVTLDVDLVVTEDDGATTTWPKTLAFTITPETDGATLSAESSQREDAAGDPGLRVKVLPDDFAAFGEAEQVFRIAIDVTAFPQTSNLRIELTERADLGGQRHVFNVRAGAELDLSGSELAKFYNAATGELAEIRVLGLPEHWSADVPVKVTAWTGHSEATAVSQELDTHVVIDADADPAKTFTVKAPVTEAPWGTPLALGVDFTLADPDGSESRYLIVDGVPDNARLSHGFNAGDGRWIVADGIDALSITGAPGAATLKVRALVRDVDPDDRNVTTWESEPATVSVTFTGDPGDAGASPTLDYSYNLVPAQTVEDSWFTLTGSFQRDPDNPSAGLSDVSALIVGDLPDGTEVRSTVAGAFSFYYDAATQTYVIPRASIESGAVQIKPPADWHGTLTYTVRAVAQDATGYHGGTQATAAEIAVPVTPETDGVRIMSEVNGGNPVVEDTTSVDVTLTLKAKEGGSFSETFTDGDDAIIRIRPTAELPEDAAFVVGKQTLVKSGDAYEARLAWFTGGAGAASLLATGSTVVLSGLTVKLPEDWHGKVAFDVAFDVSDDGTDSEVSSGSVAFDVAAVNETGAILTTPPENPTEDEAFALNAQVLVDDRLGVDEYGSERLSVVVRGVPEGAILKNCANNGVYTGDDGKLYTEWVVKQGFIDAEGNLKNVEVVPPEDWSGTMTLEIRAYSLESGSRSDTPAATTTLDVTVAPVTDPGSVDPQDARGREFEAIDLTLNAQQGDADGSETAWVVITGVPADAQILCADGSSVVRAQAGADGRALFAGGAPVAAAAATATGVWVLTEAQAANAQFLGGEDFSGVVDLASYIVTMDGEAAPVETTPLAFSVTVTGVADRPTLTLPAEAPRGVEDQAREDGVLTPANGIVLGLAGVLGDPDGETLSLIIRGAPRGTGFAGADGAINWGTPDPADAEAWFWVIEGKENIDALRMIPPENHNGEVALNLELKATEEGTSSSVTESLTVTVAAANDAPTVAINTSQPAGGDGTSPILIFAAGDDHPNPVTITDVDTGDMIASMTVAISTGAGQGDTLGITGRPVSFDPFSGRLEVEIDGHRIGLSYDAGSRALTFSGEASHDTYERLAESVILTNADGRLDAGERHFTLTVRDKSGGMGSFTSSTDVTAETTLSGDARGEVLFVSGDSATLTGTEGDDLIVYGIGGASDVTIDGAGGADTLAIMNQTGQEGDWLLAVDSADPTQFSASSKADPDAIVFEGEVTGGTAAKGKDDSVSITSDDTEAPATATITFDDHKVTAEEVETIVS